MIPKPDFVAKEVDQPPRRWCKVGHEAPATFRRDGPAMPEQPTKFFQVTSTHMPQVNGIYCEPCLFIANAMKAAAKSP